MNCERARRAVSERMDGERLPRHAASALEQHLAACAECRAFQTGAYRLREWVRIGLAPAVPDLVEPIMTTVRAEARPILARARPSVRRERGGHSFRAWRPPSPRPSWASSSDRSRSAARGARSGRPPPPT